jgi:hypothetical protein
MNTKKEDVLREMRRHPGYSAQRIKDIEGAVHEHLLSIERLAQGDDKSGAFYQRLFMVMAVERWKDR